MGYVDPDKPDLFVSYSHVNDHPLDGVGRGWVSTFVDHLSIQLAMKLGRREAVSIWMDHALVPNASMAAEIEKKLRETATFLAVLSPGYFASDWTGREMKIFSNLVRTRHR